MKSFSLIASFLALAAMASAAPAENADLAAEVQAGIALNNAAEAYNQLAGADAAMIGHTLCACQGILKTLDWERTVSTCADLKGEMETFDRKVDENNVKFFGKYCKPHDTKKLDGKGFNKLCKNHGATDSTCPWKD